MATWSSSATRRYGPTGGTPCPSRGAQPVFPLRPAFDLDRPREGVDQPQHLSLESSPCVALLLQVVRQSEGRQGVLRHRVEQGFHL